ncbi:MAG TPA: hypothetical protein VFH89_14095 [Sphingomicrobium sp.]|nr:hypothetical protein [Sphingomicrobium sp.]
MQIEANGEFGWFFRALPVMVAIGVVAYFVMRPAPRPAPSNAAVFGCYAAANSPPILLDAAGMHVRQAGYPVIPFHLERSKTGIALTANAPIRADKTTDGYQFGMNKRGIGWFMHFYRVENGQTYGVFDDSLLEGFQMLASDGTYLKYDPSDAAKCA